jgi:hypothetical protein
MLSGAGNGPTSTAAALPHLPVRRYYQIRFDILVVLEHTRYSVMFKLAFSVSD